ncbi:uncharacterized protein [Antedon mediterranea]|uniref:uncharacterized protein n=1 Tax=Antedon mediterranea TaxID=105859 RepID=UPI003AF67D2F
MTNLLIFATLFALSRVDAHDMGDNPHMQSEFDKDEGTYTYILKVPVDKEESKCQCEDEIKQLQEQLDALELRFEKVLGKLNSVTLEESLDRDGGGGNFTDELSPSERVIINADKIENNDLSQNGSRVEGPDNLFSGLDADSNSTGLESHRGMVRSRGDAPENVVNMLNLEDPNDEKIEPPGSITVNENDIKANGQAEGSDETLDSEEGLTVELSPDNIRPAKTVEESVVKVNDDKKPAVVIDKQDIDDPCTGGCACFKYTSETGVYAIKKPKKIKKKSTHMKVYCDMSTDSGGWTVIQRRFDGTENFFRSWAHYARGFGNKNSEFWIGNNFIHALTSNGKYELRIEFEDWEGQQGFAHYDSFRILDEESKYRLLLGKFVGGNRGDSMSYHNNTMFTTKDQDNDWFFGNCAVLRKSGFWFKECNHANPNGLWIGKGDGSGKNGAIITWGSWGTYGYKYCMRSFKMMVRPTRFR